MTRAQTATLLAAGVCLTLAGCVIVSENRERGGGTEAGHAVRLVRLELGTSYEAVLERFGPPLASSARRIRDVECRSLRYPLHGRSSRGDKGHETVELVFRDGRLIGWGSPLPACPGPGPGA